MKHGLHLDIDNLSCNRLRIKIQQKALNDNRANNNNNNKQWTPEDFTVYAAERVDLGTIATIR